MELHQFACREDNFGFLIHDPASGACAAIDAPAEDAVRRALADKGWQLTHILITHRHYDHIEGVLPLKEDFGCEVIAPEKARGAVPGVDRYVREGGLVQIGGLEAEVWEVPGHCTDHVAYWFGREKTIFVGDTLFAIGCGRVFDGAYDDMWKALSRLMALSDDTRVYFGHEYTLANAKFALSIDPENRALKARFAEVVQARARGEATCPTTIGQEKATNPFLRAGDSDIQARLNMAGAPIASVFRELRERKNRF